jgi:phosphate transport system substrate-binding protein
MKGLFLIGLVLLVSACGSPDVSTPAPTPIAINVIYPNALQPWADKLAICASDDRQVALYFSQSNAMNTNIHANEIMLELGQTSLDNVDSYLSQVGSEQIAVVVNTDNQLSQLSDDEIKAIFSGQLSKWVIGSNQLIQVWVLPMGDPARMIFDQAVMLNQSLTSDAMLAPDPDALLEAISTQVDSIGYLPGSFLNTMDATTAGKVKIVQLESSLEADLHQPVIAITKSEPKDLLRNLLVCLQTTTP